MGLPGARTGGPAGGRSSAPAREPAEPPGGLLSRRRPRSHRRRAQGRFAGPLIVLLVVASATVTGAVAHPSPPGYPPGPLQIATGDRGTVYFSYGYALMEAVRRELPQVRPYLTVTPSNQRNVELVTASPVAVGFASADTITGLPERQTRSLRTLARLYEDYLHLVVRRDSRIRDLTDLRGARVSVGVDGSGTRSTATRLLRVADIADGDLTQVGLGLDDSVDALREGEIDGFFFFGGVPTTRLDELQPIRLVDLEDWVPRLYGYGSFYSRLSIPSSAYGTDPVSTVGVPTYLVVSKSMDPDLAYALTELLYTERDAMARVHRVADQLDRRAAINTLPLPLHPGATHYYRTTQI